MKNLITLIIIVIISSSSLYSSHFLGGEITWRCLSNGKYVFFMKTYRHCSGIPWNFVNETIDIVGNPLPNGRNTIIMKPDSNAFLNSNNGDISPYCTSGTQLSCSGSSAGSIQMFSYQSDPINLFGTPPTSGWKFYFSGYCCYGAYDNILNSSGMPLLRAVMYSNTSGVCSSSSPQFARQANYLICSSVKSYINYSAYSLDSDSLSYQLDYAQHGSSTSQVNLQFNGGYSLNNPTPDTIINAANSPFNLNANTGIADLKVNGINSINSRYLINVRVDAFNNGVKTSSIHRQIPLVVYNCPNLSTGSVNSTPAVRLNGSAFNGSIYYDTVLVKRTKSISVHVTDNDLQNTAQQVISLIPYGGNYSTTFTNSSSCINPGSTCAFFQNVGPTLNTSTPINRIDVQGLSTLFTQFVWLPNCGDLGVNESPKTHYFQFKVEDDFCPNPASKEITLAITVMPDTIPCALVTNIEEESVDENQLEVYPNPTSGQFNVRLNQTYKKLYMSIRNIHGQLVQESRFFNQNSLTVNIEAESGIYFVTLMNEQGEQKVLKMIKR